MGGKYQNKNSRNLISIFKFKFQVVDQLFARLDSDGDGRVAFEDLLDMFQSGGGGGSGLVREGEQQPNVFEGEEPQSQEQVS